MAFELCYTVMIGTEYFVSLQTSVVTTEGYNIMVNSEEPQNIWRYRRDVA
jgi:hypothetical protein